MSVKIYVVFGESGECSGMERWMVKAYYNHDDAKLLVENAKKEADLLTIKANNEEIWPWDAKSTYDQHYRMVYHEVTYDIVEVELE